MSGCPYPEHKTRSVNRLKGGANRKSTLPLCRVVQIIVYRAPYIIINHSFTPTICDRPAAGNEGIKEGIENERCDSA